MARWPALFVGFSTMVVSCSVAADDTDSRGMTDVGATSTAPAAVDQCDPDVLGETEGPIVVIHRVDQRRLGERCHGEPFAVMFDSWDALTEIAPPQELDAIRFFVGYRGSSDLGTVAYAGPVDELDNDAFQIAVDVDSSAGDDGELRATMAHEMAHVFTQQRDQLDPGTPRRDCEGFHNGFGCFETGSYVNLWVEEFWTDSAIEALPRSGAIDPGGGFDRCSTSPEYLGGYAASHPEEDLAESFAAYVLSVEVSSEVEPRLAFFDRYPRLVGYRDRAAAAGFADQPVVFEECG